MSAPLPLQGTDLDETWLNDRSEFQQNFVHGLRNPDGLRVQYRREGDIVVGEWTAGERHLGFPGVAHGGLLLALLDDIMGRIPAMQRRWVMTARLESRFRAPAPVGVPLRIEGWLERSQRRAVHAAAQVLMPGGAVACEATGTYITVPPAQLERMLGHWPGFREYLGGRPGER